MGLKHHSAIFRLFFLFIKSLDYFSDGHRICPVYKCVVKTYRLTLRCDKNKATKRETGHYQQQVERTRYDCSNFPFFYSTPRRTFENPLFFCGLQEAKHRNPLEKMFTRGMFSACGKSQKVA